MANQEYDPASEEAASGSIAAAVKAAVNEFLAGLREEILQLRAEVDSLRGRPTTTTEASQPETTAAENEETEETTSAGDGDTEQPAAVEQETVAASDSGGDEDTADEGSETVAAAAGGDEDNDEPTAQEIAQASGGGSGDADYASPTTGWRETFDNGTGQLDHLWSGEVDTSVPGQVTLGGYTGVMERASGAEAGHGFGKYTVTAEVEGDQVGAAALLWPADNKWPGTELNFVEVLADGTAYGTAHRDEGYDWYQSVMYGVDESEVHTYGIDWQADGVTYSVDGRDVGRVETSTADAANGGVNSVFGLMNMNPATTITVYDMTYTPNADAIG